MRIDTGWRLLGTAPGALATPADLPTPGWAAASVPGTVAGALNLPLDGAPDLDASDWWYHVNFAADPSAPQRLRFDAMATLAEVWLNGERVLESRNGFLPRTVQVTGRLQADNELCIVFRALAPELAKRRAPPAWPTALVESRNLRWFRTPLLGRIPGWTPRLPPIGPWREVVLEPMPAFELADLSIQADEVDGAARLRLAASVVRARARPTSATLRVAGVTLPVAITEEGGHLRLSAAADLPGVPLWWPRQHGEPALHTLTLHLTSADGAAELSLGRVGFRSVAVDRTGGRIQFVINGRPIFLRGACWTADDPRTLDGPSARTRVTLQRLADAGANAVRLGGTMTWGNDTFYDTCDELGLLVWQDLMFANCDYPFTDANFRAQVEEEVGWALGRLHRRACVVAFCGGSEVEQQAAMMGVPTAQATPTYYREELAAAVEAKAPGIPYFPSTPTGGPLPFSTREGLTHYYGVGAYRRPPTDARRAGVRFTPECLAFANIPDDAGLPTLPGGAIAPPHHPAWKAGVPRDNGAGWDFDDVRDHYVRELFGVDPVDVRYADVARYRAIGRATSAELMLRTMAEWRRPGSGCGGAFVWFLQDLRPGAGWGILDSGNRPKSVWWALRRAWAPHAVLFTDEGLDGLDLHVVNETPAPLRAEVEWLFFHGKSCVEQARVPVEVAAFGGATFSASAMAGRFVDLTWAYRFGPPRGEVVVARLWHDGQVLGEDAWFPLGLTLPMVTPELAATVSAQPDGSVELHLQTDVFLQALRLEPAPGWCAGEDHLHLSPGVARRVRFTPAPGARPFRVALSALNADDLPTVRL